MSHLSHSPRLSLSSPHFIKDQSIMKSNSTKRNYMLESMTRDSLIYWMKEMLMHSFVLGATESYVGTMEYFEQLIEEHRNDPTRSRLKQYVPSVGVFHTPLHLSEAFQIYDQKYSISLRCHVSPSFHEIRHILNLAQVMSIADNLKMISFDGDQTLYSDGGNFEENEELSNAIMHLLRKEVKVIVITAAGYGLDGSKYEVRLQGLLNKFFEYDLPQESLTNFYVVGGECNYLLQCQRIDNKARLVAVPYEYWQADDLNGPKPHNWPQEEVTELLNVAENSMKQTVIELKLRAKIMRKERAV
eukprot:gene12414-16647_t